jgi:hypothetical protein
LSDAYIREDVLKRDVLEGEGADAARKQVSRAAGRTLRTEKKLVSEVSSGPSENRQELAQDSVA